MDSLANITPDIVAGDISSASYNSSPWNEDQTLPKYKSDKVILHKDNFFGQLKISDTSPLHTIVDRSACPNCHKSLKFFCYDCYLPLENTKCFIPKISKLPCHVDVIKHPGEVAGKVRWVFNKKNQYYNRLFTIHNGPFIYILHL